MYLLTYILHPYVNVTDHSVNYWLHTDHVDIIVNHNTNTSTCVHRDSRLPFLLCSTILGASIFLSSLGMAIYRLMCIRNLMMEVSWRKNLIKYILVGELIIGIIWTLALIGTTLYFGNPVQHFCMYHGEVFAEILHRYAKASSLS